MQDTPILDTFAIERHARALRAQATRRMMANLRSWLSQTLSGAARAPGKPA